MAVLAVVKKIVHWHISVQHTVQVEGCPNDLLLMTAYCTMHCATARRPSVTQPSQLNTTDLIKLCVCVCVCVCGDWEREVAYDVYSLCRCIIIYLSCIVVSSTGSGRQRRTWLTLGREVVTHTDFQCLEQTDLLVDRQTHTHSGTHCPIGECK